MPGVACEIKKKSEKIPSWKFVLVYVHGIPMGSQIVS